MDAATYIFENSKLISDFSEDTALYFYEPEKKLFVAKKTNGNRQEYEKLLSVKSQYLAPVTHVLEKGAGVVVIRPYIAGDTLDTVLQKEGKMPEQQALKLAAEIADGLSVLHKNGLVHRDINPANIVITVDGHAKIIDYGITRSYKTSQESDTAILGTPGYAAPEQFGFSQSDSKTDIYSLGVLLHVMLTGHMPKPSEVHGAVGKIIKKCMQIDAKKRFRSTKELSTALWSHVKGYRAGKFFASVPGLSSEYAAIRVLATAFYVLACFITLIFAVSIRSLRDLLSYGSAGFCFFGIPFLTAILFKKKSTSQKYIFGIGKTVLLTVVSFLSFIAGCFLLRFI